MRYILIILTSILCQLSYGQFKKLLINGHKYANIDHRILIDCGGNGVGDHASFIDVGEMTPNNSARVGQDASGKYWNNLTNGAPSTILLGNVVDINGVSMGNLNISVDKWSRGTFSSTDSNMNFQGAAAAVGDYVLTATMDSWYFHSTAGTTTMSITIPAGYTATIKFWGSRATTGANRTLQVKKSTDGSYTQMFNSLNNTTYTQAATLSGLTGTVSLNFLVQPGQTFGHLGVIDVLLEPTP